MKPPDETSARRSRRRPGAAEISHAVFDRTLPYRHLRNPFTPLRVFSDDQVAALHDAALVILESQGMKVLSDDARGRYRDAGCEVDESTQIVRVPRELVAASLATARSAFQVSMCVTESLVLPSAQRSWQGTPSPVTVRMNNNCFRSGRRAFEWP